MAEFREVETWEAESQELEDRQLIHQSAAGEKEALEELYSRYGTAVYSMARYMLRNEALAEEATQEVFLNIWLKAASYNAERGRPKAWVMSVAPPQNCGHNPFPPSEYRYGQSHRL